MPHRQKEGKNQVKAAEQAARSEREEGRQCSSTGPGIPPAACGRGLTQEQGKKG